MIYLELFISFFQIGLFSFGGGYAAISLIKHQVVDVRGWMSIAEFADIVTISQMTPGPIGINAATFAGVKMGGFPGAIVATFSCVLPSLIIVILLAKIYYKYRNLSFMKGILSGLRPAVVALIASAGMTLLILALFNEKTNRPELVSFIIFAIALFILRKWKLNPIIIMLLCGIVGAVVFSVV